MGTIPALSIAFGEKHALTGPHLLHRIFEAVAQNNSIFEKTALVFKSSHTTFGTLDNSSSRLARVLLRHVREKKLPSNPDGDFLVAVNMAPGDDLVVLLMAILKMGAAYVPLDLSFPEERVAQILRDSAPVFVVAASDKRETLDASLKLMESPVPMLLYEKILQESLDQEEGPILDTQMLPAARERLAVVLYTSGSTGTPKGVRLPHKAILNRLRWQWRTFPYKNDEVSCFKTTLTFVDSLSEIFGPLLQGHPVLVVPKEVIQNPESFVRILEDYGISRLVLVPSLLRSILLYLALPGAQGRLRKLRLWVCSGEILPVDLLREFFERFPTDHVICNFYGSTEVMADVTYEVFSSKDDVRNKVVDNKVPIGRAIDNTHLYLLDKQQRPVLLGETGELYVAGRNLAAGYVGRSNMGNFMQNPLATDAEISEMFKTGDFARFVKDTLIYEGRADSQVKVRGHRVDLTEVGMAVQNVNGVDNTVTLCYKPGEVNQAIVAFVTLKEPLSKEDITEALRHSLPPYMMPQVKMMNTIPILVNGKTDRQRLLRIFDEEVAGSEDFRQVSFNYGKVPDAKIPAAKALFETIASVLGAGVSAKLSPESNFYEIGGNSLNSIYVVTKVRDQGYVIEIGDFISAENLGQIIDKMVPEDEWERTGSPEKAIASRGNYSTELLNDSHRDDVYRIILSSFYEKADFGLCLMAHVMRADYVELLDKLWENLVKKNFSFIVRASSGKVVGAAFNYDANDEPEVVIESKLSIVFDFLESLEAPIRDHKLPQGVGQVLHSFMMGTDPDFGFQENIDVIIFMEEEVLKITKERGFTGMFSTNTSPLTQQLGMDVYNYDVLLDYQVNQYVAPDGTKPFGAALDSQRAVCQWKEV